MDHKDGASSLPEDFDNYEYLHKAFRDVSDEDEVELNTAIGLPQRMSEAVEALTQSDDNPLGPLAEVLLSLSSLDDWMKGGDDSLAAHLRALGFPVHTSSELRQLITEDIPEYETIETARGLYRWRRDASGAEIWLHGTHDGRIVGLAAHFNGPARLLSSLQYFQDDDEHDPMYGSVHGWADPWVENPDFGEHPIAYEMPDFGVYEALELPVVRQVQITAFAHKLVAYPDEEVFFQTQDAPRMASQAYFPMGLQAMFTGIVRDCAQLTNGLTGKPFFWAWVSTLGGDVNIVAEPDIVQGEIVVGGVIKGTFCLSGRLVEG